jgi:ATP-dependent RNA helicase DeaD
MKRFKTRSMQLLIATDVAARGIDVNDLTHVLHHSLPDQLESYTHRSGRTGRAGKKGVSLLFINSREVRKIGDLERKLNVKFEKIEVPSIDILKSSRINNWANLIINTKVDEKSEDILQQLHGQFEHLSKEDLLKRLITTQLDHLMIHSGEGDLNESQGSSSRSERKTKAGVHRYFINIGEIDGMTKADLIHFISDVSGIDRNHFGDISIQKNCAFIDVASAHDKGLSERFDGVEIEGRSIRVNRDDNARHSSSGGGSAPYHKRSGGRDRKEGGFKGGSRSRERSPRKEFRGGAKKRRG